MPSKFRPSCDEAAAFGEVVVPVTAAVSLTVGGRVFTAPNRVSSTNQAPSAGGTVSYAGGVGGVGFAPKVVVAYSPSPQALVYVQASEGYRSAGVNTTGPSNQVFGGAGAADPQRVFQGDELWSLEAGGKFKFCDDRLRIQLIAFDAFWKNIQSDQLLTSGLPFTANIGDGQNIGVEFEAGYRVGGLDLNGQLLLNKPELTKASPAFAARTDFTLSAVPDLSVGASARYTWALGGDRTLALDGRWAYVGSSRLVLSASTAPKMGDYATARLAATLAARRWEVTVAIDNPADVYGNTFAYGNPFTVRTTRQITPLRPRTLSVALKLAY